MPSYATVLKGVGHNSFVFATINGDHAGFPSDKKGKKNPKKKNLLGESGNICILVSSEHIF